MERFLKKLSSLTSCLSPQRGFTLVELIVVFAIISVISALGIASFSSFSNNQQVKTSSLDIINMLNTAKSRSFSQIKPPQCNAEKLSGYEVGLNISTGQYALSVVCDNTYKLDNKTLPKNVTFAPGSATDIFFPILAGAPPVLSTIGISGYGKTQGITIDTGGNISTTQTFIASNNPIIPTPTACPWWDCMSFSTPIPTSSLPTSVPTTPTPILSPTPTSVQLPTSTPTPTPGAGIISGQIYRLTNACGGNVLAVRDGSTAWGADIIQWHWTGGLEQQWQINSTGGNYYSLTAQHSGKLINISGASTADGAQAIQWYDSPPATNEQWSINSLGGGYYELLARHSGKALDVSGGTPYEGAIIDQWSENGSCAQQWKIENIASLPVNTPTPTPTLAIPTNTPVPTATPTPSPTPFATPTPTPSAGIAVGHAHRLTNACSGKVLAVSGASMSDGASVIQWHWTGGLEQQWQINTVWGGYYSLAALHSNKLLNIAGADNTDGSWAIQWGDTTPATNEQWQITSVGGGYYKLLVRSSGKALDVSNSSTADGAQVQQWTPNGSCAQQWKIENL